MDIDAGQNWSWILKKIMKHKQMIIHFQQIWTQMLITGKFSMRLIYKELIDDRSVVNWTGLIMHNMARPKSRITLWMLCHGNLSTKDRL